jgi:hypothetical protein
MLQVLTDVLLPVVGIAVTIFSIGYSIFTEVQKRKLEEELQKSELGKESLQRQRDFYKDEAERNAASFLAVEEALADLRSRSAETTLNSAGSLDICGQPQLGADPVETWFSTSEATAVSELLLLRARKAFSLARGDALRAAGLSVAWHYVNAAIVLDATEKAIEFKTNLEFWLDLESCSTLPFSEAFDALSSGGSTCLHFDPDAVHQALEDLREARSINAAGFVGRAFERADGAFVTLSEQVGHHARPTLEARVFRADLAMRLATHLNPMNEFDAVLECTSQRSATSDYDSLYADAVIGKATACALLGQDDSDTFTEIANLARARPLSPKTTDVDTLRIHAAHAMWQERVGDRKAALRKMKIIDKCTSAMNPYSLVALSGKCALAHALFLEGNFVEAVRVAEAGLRLRTAEAPVDMGSEYFISLAGCKAYSLVSMLGPDGSSRPLAEYAIKSAKAALLLAVDRHGPDSYISLSAGLVCAQVMFLGSRVKEARELLQNMLVNKGDLIARRKSLADAAQALLAMEASL